MNAAETAVILTWAIGALVSYVACTVACYRNALDRF